MTSSSSAKKTRRKQKIEMKRIENKTDRLIRFSKRKSGIIKKASELVTLTGCHVAILMYSPSGKVYGFGHPSVGEVAIQYLSRSRPTPNDCAYLTRAKIDEMNRTRDEALKQIEVCMAKQLTLKPRIEEIPKEKLWVDSAEEATVQELKEMESTYMNLLEKIEKRQNDIVKSMPK